MREIKFRGQMTTKKWVYGLPHLDAKDSTAYWNECSYRICWHNETGGQSNAPVKNGTIGLFAGVKDITEREIYEGDIVEWIDTDGNERIDVVKWVKGGLCLGNDGYTVGSYIDRGLKVIGNIHDNPELLKTGKR